MSAPVAIYCLSPTDGRLRQGEIISDLRQGKINIEALSRDKAAPPKIDYFNHPLAIIISQDCDLEQDFNLDRDGKAKLGSQLPSILFCEVHEAEKVRVGPPNIASDLWRRVKTNKDERYHLLQKVAQEQDRQGQGFPTLIVDFKRYFTIPTVEVYFRLQEELKRRCFLASPYLEHFMVRLFHYQSRVALPVEHAAD